MELPQEAIDLILQFEIGGSRKYYERFLARPSWPGGASGVTIGIGYDLGYDKKFTEDWQDKLSSSDFTRLKRTLSLKGSQAKQAISGVRDIVISWDDAMAVFQESTLPVYIEQTLEAFPKSEFLPPAAFGALVSLVFNRGPLVDDTDRRREMKAIKNILALGNDDEVDADDIREIARQVRSMSRLWKDDLQSDGDLHDRREDEAALILSSL